MKLLFWFKKHTTWSWAWLGASAITLNLIDWFLVWWRLPFSESSVPIHYHAYFGIDLLAAGWHFWLICFLGLVVAVGHFFWARAVVGQSRITALKILIISNVVQMVTSCYLILLIINFFIQ
ncbi:MAG: hypothetical protein NTV81_01465 [Candidatus Komeilibacteria bacterium]|nr:hypothetical protein [Candidatus Komeilibacteria bacterium]